MEYAGACYHVINRGNYRSWIFETKGARESFLKCLGQACESMGWRLHAWCLMGNHYHLCLKTPQPNLVEGMKWLSKDEAEQKRLDFENMCRGWAKGTREFKEALLKDEGDGTERVIVEAEASEMREPRWERALSDALACLGRSEDELSAGKKGEAWKVAVARHLRERCLAPHRWIAENMGMGSPSYVQSLVSRHRRGASERNWEMLQTHGKLD